MKQHLTRHLGEVLQEGRRAGLAEPTREDADPEVKRTASAGKHLRLETPLEKILLIRIVEQEEVAEEELVAELGQILGEIGQRGGCKAVVLASEYREFLPGGRCRTVRSPMWPLTWPRDGRRSC